MVLPVINKGRENFRSEVRSVLIVLINSLQQNLPKRTWYKEDSDTLLEQIDLGQTHIRKTL